MCAFRFQRFSVYLTPLCFVLFVKFIKHLQSCIKKISTKFFLKSFSDLICLVYWQHCSLSNANILRHFCPFIIGDIRKNNSLTSGHLRSPRHDYNSETHYHIINVTIITDVVTSYELVHCCRTKVIIC